MPSNHYLFLSFPLHWPPYLVPSAPPPAPRHQCFPMLHIVSGLPSPASRALHERDLSHPLSLFPYSSAGKESAYNAGDPGLIPGSGRSTGDGIGYTLVFLGFPCGSAGKESAHNTGDQASICGFGRFPGEGNGYPL